MHVRTGKLLGVAVATAAIVFAGTAVTAQAEEPTSPNMIVPKPEGPACDATVKAVPSGPGSLATLSKTKSSAALANIPQISTFSSIVSGQFNPEVNVAAVLDNGPYVVFAPTNEAFAKLAPEQLEALRTDPVALTALVYYHMALGILGPNEIQGVMYTQEGKPVVIKGKGGDITVNDAKVVCGGIGADNMRLYMIDTVLDPATAPEGITATTTSTTSTETTEAPESTPETTTAETPAAAGDAETPVTVTVTETAAG